MKAPLTIGIIGAGSAGLRHLRQLCTQSDVRVVGIHDRDDGAGRAAAALAGVRYFEDLEALIQRVEAVTVAVPATDHLAVGRVALDHGVAVLMEKPLAASLDEADLLLEVAERRGALLQVGHVERFNPAVRAVQPHLDHPLYLESSRLAPFLARGADVSVVLDLMIHDLDLMLHLLGTTDVSCVRANGFQVRSAQVDVANTWIEFATGASAFASASRVSRTRVRRLRIWQESGYFSLDLAVGSARFVRRPPEWTREPEEIHLTADAASAMPEADPLSLQMQSFSAAVRTGTDPAVTGYEGRAAMELALRVVEAMRTRQLSEA